MAFARKLKEVEITGQLKQSKINLLLTILVLPFFEKEYVVRDKLSRISHITRRQRSDGDARVRIFSHLSLP